MSTLVGVPECHSMCWVQRIYTLCPDRWLHSHKQSIVNWYVTFSVAPLPKKVTSRGTHRPQGEAGRRTWLCWVV